MVLIKDMEMPKTCGHCRLTDYDVCACKVSGKKLSAWKVSSCVGRPKDCPLVEVEQYGPEGTLYKEK